MNVDALVARARDEVATRRTFAAQMSSSDTRLDRPLRDYEAAVAAIDAAGADAAAAPEPSLEAASAEALMPLAGRAFVAQAYRAVLGREADGAGLDYHTEALRQGRMTRADVLLSLAESAEGRARPRPLPGLHLLGRQRARHSGMMGRWWAIVDFLREGPAMRRLAERREHEVAERERLLAAAIGSLAAVLNDVQAQLCALDESKAPREPSLHLAMHVAALQSRVKELQEAAAAR